MWWHTVTHCRGIEGESGEWSGYPVLFTLPRNMVHPALLPLMRTPRLPVADWTDAPLADLNGLVRFAERRNLVSARVPSRLKRGLPKCRWCLEVYLDIICSPLATQCQRLSCQLRLFKFLWFSVLVRFRPTAVLVSIHPQFLTRQHKKRRWHSVLLSEGCSGHLGTVYIIAPFVLTVINLHLPLVPKNVIFFARCVLI